MQEMNKNFDGQNSYHILQQVEVITDALKWLLIQQVITVNEEDVRREVTLLEKWMESYRSSIIAASKITKADIEWLSDLCGCLKSAVEERKRLYQNVTTYSPNNEQAQMTDELMQAVYLIHKRIPDIELMFGSNKSDYSAA